MELSIDNKLLVSICCITYNHEKYIAKAMDSFLMQKTLFNYEIIVGEDMSNDGTREICRKYASQYPSKIKLFERSREDVININGKPTGRFNLIETLKAAKGKYIAICEGDDYWTDPLKLQKQVDFLEENPAYSFCCHNYNRISNGKIIEAKNRSDRDINLIDILRHDLKEIDVRTLTLMIRNVPEIFESFFKDCKNMISGDFPITALAACYGLGYYMNDVMGVYRLHQKGVSVHMKKTGHLWFDERLPILNLLTEKNLVPKNIRNEFKIFSSKVSNYYGRLLWEKGEYYKSLFYLKKSFPFVKAKLFKSA